MESAVWRFLVKLVLVIIMFIHEIVFLNNFFFNLIKHVLIGE